MELGMSQLKQQHLVFDLVFSLSPFGSPDRSLKRSIHGSIDFLSMWLGVLQIDPKKEVYMHV